MNLTPQMKQWLQKHCDVAADADDNTYRDALAKALADGKLDKDTLIELTKDPDGEKADEVMGKLDSVVDGIGKLAGLLEAQVKAAEAKKDAEPEPKKDAPKDDKAATDDGTSVGDEIAKQSGDDGGEVRVKRASERYNKDCSRLHYPEHTRGGAPHGMAGQAVTYCGQPVMSASDLAKAQAGAWAKLQIQASLMKGLTSMAFQKLTEHERELVAELCETGEWDDSQDGRSRKRIGFPGGVKALIDDATSGGLEAAPIVFDDMVISAPLLTNELFPLVKVVPLDRGRRVEGVATGNVTGSWGGVDASAITLFNTASYVSAFDTTIYRWQGAVQIGLDFLSDTPIDFGAHITGQYGERLAEDLDDAIAAGNGTNQPEGVINKSGAGSVAFSGSTTIGAYESLRFGVTKQEHKPGLANTIVFCGTETSYQRARAIPVGATDARRIFGLDYDSYSLMNRPYKISGALANTQVFYAVLGGYRMYRRRGLTVRTSTEGDTLIRNNELLIAVTARWGGQMERGAQCAVATDAPS